ncbi:putative trehalose-phosphate phosphatase J [Dorcoceras hygrometricum]|uniref:Trehalose 6-phosphate phosphatase n=1 Tax=Dorcoceras hygrometricum TaxID=472368 RepID=A0A2Z7B4N8_9LAMI|nr:putative trehalose-phosphate phosphatase J [Dorcoceras hygrometricum]
MTNQNMVISDAKSCLTMAIAAAMSESTMLPQKPLISQNGYLSLKKILKKLESCGNGARINPLLDSMRASSPTRRASDAKDQSSWTLRLPSALSMFEEMMSVSKGKQIVVFLDYDGTLSPIVEDPEHAFMTNEMRDAVKGVAKFFPTAIVSGRSRAKVYSFVRLSELYYAGSHGMDIKGPTEGLKRGRENQTVLCQPAREFLPIINEVYRTLIDKIKHIPGAKVENNKFCLSVHYRCVEEKNWAKLGDEVKSIVKGYQQLRLTQGRKVIEIRPTIKWDKGNALEFLLESLGYAEWNDIFPIYIGDDRTDEDAFKVIRRKGQGLGILVSESPKETYASYSLNEPSEVMDFLTQLVEWKQSQYP